MMTTTSGEKVKCRHCEKILMKKKLQNHTKKVHIEGIKIELVSILSANIRKMFSSRLPK